MSVMSSFRHPVALAIVISFLFVACKREGRPTDVAAPPAIEPIAEAPAADAPPTLDDVIEHDPRYIVGISYPEPAKRYPGLALALHDYAQGARKDLMDAVAELGDGKPAAPYDLSLGFSMVADTPQVVAVAAEGSTYTGGAHGNPLVARFVWLPAEQKLLDADELITGRTGWRAVSAYVREQLHTALSQRVDADDLEPAERAEVVRSAAKMIDEGSDPDADNFRQFEPMVAPDGRLRGLRFVFPPYQVGPYSDGVQTVDVPAEVLLPHIAEAYRPLFAGG